MRLTSWSTLALVALVSALVSWVVLDVAASAGILLTPSAWFTAVFLLLASAWLLVRGRGVRRMVAGERTRMTPLLAARVVSLAKASSLTGSLLAGWFVAQLVWASGNAAAPLNREIMVGALIDLGASLVLVGVGMLVEHWCHVQPPEDDDTTPNHPTATAA